MLFSIISGITVTVIGYYTPFVIASSVFMAIGAGLLSTFDVNTSEGKWIGYQIVFGMGVGMGMQQALIMAQTVLDKKDVPIGTTIVMFAQLIGGAIFISVGQNIFTNKLLSNVQRTVRDISPKVILATGATSLKTVIPPADLPAVQVAYNGAIVNTFYVAVGVATLSMAGAVFWEWKSVKGKKIEMGGGA